MHKTGQSTPELALKAEGLISAGYQLLLTYEHDEGGFSWFGEPGDPNVSVTALGLLEFSDMAEVFPVDEAMIARTRAWLAGKQNADGSWPSDISEFFTVNTSALRNTAFCAWALAAAGHQGPELARGMTYVAANTKTATDDSYTLAIVANALLLAGGDAGQKGQVLGALAERAVTEDGLVHWTSGETQTSFYGAGDSGDVETTALVAHALLLDGGYPALTAGAVDYLLSKKDKNGNFGSTQATVWALRTILLSAQTGTSGATGVVTLTVDGEPAGEVELTESQWDVMTTVDLSAFAKAPGATLTLDFAGEGKLSYNAVSGYHLPWDLVPGGAQGPLSVAIAYDKTTLAVNSTATATLSVTNHTDAAQKMVMLTVGIPPGFEVLTEDLAPYLEAQTLSKVETTNKQLVLYVLDLPGSATQAFEYRVRATMPVTASDGGATAYLYYEPEVRHAVAATTLEATAD